MSDFGETLPYHENRMFLNYDKLDKWGFPTIFFDAEFKENQRKMKKDWKVQSQKYLKLLVVKMLKYMIVTHLLTKEFTKWVKQECGIILKLQL